MSSRSHFHDSSRVAAQTGACAEHINPPAIGRWNKQSTMMNKKIIFFGLAGLLTSLLSISAHAVVSMSFSGGVNSPVVFTLNQSVQYTITTTPTELAPAFVFQGVGDLFSNSFPDVSGTMTYSVNSGSPLTLNAININSGSPPLTLNTVNSGIAIGDVAANDLYFFGPNAFDPVGWLHAGDVVTLWSGQLETTQNFTLTLPLSGDFSTFMVDAYGCSISTASDCVAPAPIPEPETYALMLAGLAVVGAAAKRRARRAQ